ncbi:MAG TPA: ATP-binding protein [Candidatus Altiarchaeales archaeon]|nr:ATP-binding protein [Candidatus Altiarchaeales archaeon]
MQERLIFNKAKMEIGQIIGATTLRGFRFVIKKGMEKHVKRDEFVIVNESVTNNKILGIIKDITISNELLPDEFGRDLRLGDIILNEGEYPVPTVKILGYECENGLELPRHGIKPGSSVKLADDNTLKRILRQEKDTSALIGTLSTRESVPVYVSVNDIVSRHCAILAMTGAGKSYTVGVLIEELLKKRGSVIVFDPHGEYKWIRLEGSVTRVYGVRGDHKIKVETSSLRSIDFINLIPDLTDAQRDLIDAVINLARKFYDKYDLKIVKEILSLIYDAKEGKEILTGSLPESEIKDLSKRVGLTTIGPTMRKIERLSRMGIFELEGTPLDEIVSGNQLTVIDLSDADERLSETIIAAISRRIFEARKAYVKDGEGNFNTPTFLVIEEAHNFAPRTMEERTILSKSILKKIAREGRKFGVGLCIVSQRPSRLDSDILSQCNTQIIMRIVNPSDQEYIRQSVESVTEDIVRDLPSLSRGEAIVVGAAINLPVTVRIRKRITEVGGEDVDIVGEWSKNAGGKGS